MGEGVNVTVVVDAAGELFDMDSLDVCRRMRVRPGLG